MSEYSSCKSGCKNTRLVITVIGILGVFLIAAGFVWIVRSQTKPAPISTARVQERRKAAAEVEAAKRDLHTYARIDAAKGSYRLPIEQAMEIVQRDWKNTSAGRSNIIARWAKVNPPPPPPEVFE